jgi:16S rRNA A1518/A1519 N6-dimethyltransferase RsmA/KsgA/DIM1 with predicted DNA glycosylase/AP lyase activity
MVQKEVADKLTYVPGKKENTALGAFFGEIGTLTTVTFVDRSAFSPSPKVDSAFVQIDWEREASYDDYLLFRAFFKDPNKTIRNCLLQSPKYKAVTATMVEKEPKLMASRARQLSVDDLSRLAKEVRKEASLSD